MTPRHHRIPGWIAAVALGLVALTGCGLQPSARVIEPVGPALSANLTPVRRDAPALAAVAVAPAPVASFEVRADDLAFAQQTIAVAAPGLYRVRLVNQDDVAHEVVFDDGSRLAAAPGASTSALVSIPAEGSAFICVIPAHRAAGMVGQITVTE